MASTYVNDLRLNEMATGDQSGSWGTVTNTNLELIAEAFSFGTEGITTNADTHTTTIADGATDPGRSMFLKYTGTLDSACTITIAPNTVSKLWFIENGTSGSQNIIIKQGSGATITIPPGDTKAIYSDGAGSGAAMVDAFASLSVVDLKVQDDLTVTDDLIVGGDIDLEGSIDVNGTANLDVVDIDGAVQLDATFTVGANDQGYDVKFFGDTASAYMLWDASADDLILGGAAGLSVNSAALVTGVLTTTAATVFNGGFASNAACTITTADNLSGLIVASTDADAQVGPTLQLKRNSGSPADADNLGNIIFVGENDADEAIVYGNIGFTAPDVSDGTEDGLFFLNVINAGTERSRMFMNATETVFNEESLDLDFRVESNGNANMLFVDGGNNAVGIGTSSPTAKLSIKGGAANSANLLLTHDTDGTGNYSKIRFQFAEGNTSIASEIRNIQRVGGASGSSLAFFTENTSTVLTERMRIDSSGNLLVGKTVTTLNTEGHALAPTFARFTRDGAAPVQFNRTTSDGDITIFYKDGSTVGSIGVGGGDQLFISRSAGSQGIKFKNGGAIPCNADGSDSDNDQDLGISSVRWDDIYATNGTIQTSDANEKQDIAALTSAEMLVAKRISALFKTFRWKDKVAAKGNDARTHTGIIAQDVQAAFTAESLDAGDYSLFISSTWWEHDVEVPAVEAVAEVTDEDGNVTTEAVEAVDAYTRTDTYDTEDEAPAGATSKTRMGIRYPELLSFVAAYNEQRFASIETRLTALEG